MKAIVEVDVVALVKREYGECGWIEAVVDVDVVAKGILAVYAEARVVR